MAHLAPTGGAATLSFQGTDYDGVSPDVPIFPAIMIAIGGPALIQLMEAFGHGH